MPRDTALSRTPPPVSLGLPVRNGARYLDGCLAAIAAQSFVDFELLISDNASTDATRDIASDYAERDPRIRYVRNAENRGVSYNFNRLVEDTRGPFFKWVVYDDLCEPDYLLRCVELLNELGDHTVLAYPKTTLIDGEEAVIGHHNDKADLRDPNPRKRAFHLVRDLHYCHPALGLIRRSALTRTRLIDNYESSDETLLFELALIGRFAEVPLRLYRRRLHAGTVRNAETDSRQRDERMNPANRGRTAMNQTRVAIGMARSVAHAELGSADKAFLYGAIFRYRFGRFWRSILSECGARLAWEFDHRQNGRSAHAKRALLPPRR